VSRSTTPLPFQVGVCVAATPDGMPFVAFDSYAAQSQGKWRWSHYRRAPSVLVAVESVPAYALALERVRLVSPVDLRVTARYASAASRSEQT
jgi:hypothetical protein